MVHKKNEQSSESCCFVKMMMGGVGGKGDGDVMVTTERQVGLMRG